jgi:hypothetical protein
MQGSPSSSKSQSRRSKRSRVSLTFTLHALATVCNAVISNSLGPNVVGMARVVRRSAGIEGGVTCRVPQREAPPNVAASTVSSASVISTSVSSRWRAIVSVPARVVTKARAARWLRPRHGGRRGLPISRLSGGLVQARWDAACWHGCNSTNDTKAKTRNSAAVRASPCVARLFESGEQASMCIRACPGETSEENPSSMTNPEHRRGCAEKAEASRGALQRAIAS